MRIKEGVLFRSGKCYILVDLLQNSIVLGHGLILRPLLASNSDS